MSFSKVSSFFLLLITLVSCSKVPVTNRRQLHLVPESSIMELSFSNYSEYLKKNKTLSTDEAQVKLVKKVGSRIQMAVNKYLSGTKNSKRVRGFKWDFNVVKDSTVNAWCMPGGKVVVYTGILPITDDESGLAVVLGHEIAHAIARHGNERMSQALLLELGGVGLQVALSEKPKETQNVFLQSYGVASELGSLKYSRVHELEADNMGLIFMAMAGYDPNKAVDFWQRMAKESKVKPFEFFSTHPSDERRIQEIKDFMPKAMKYYKPI